MSGTPVNSQTDELAALKEETFKANPAAYMVPVIFLLLLLSFLMAYAVFKKSKRLEMIKPVEENAKVEKDEEVVWIKSILYGSFVVFFILFYYNFKFLLK